MMFCWCTLVLLTLVPVVTGDNSVVKIKLTKKGLDLGKCEQNINVPCNISNKSESMTVVEGMHCPQWFI